MFALQLLINAIVLMKLLNFTTPIYVLLNVFLILVFNRI